MSNNDVWIKIEKKNKIKFPEDNINKKKILCTSYLTGEKCQYGDKCMYAHSIADQKMEYLKKRAYDIIQNEFDLSYLDFTKNYEMDDLLKVLICFTKVCHDCANKKCAGGVNCKFGVYDKALQICHDDMFTGKCNNKCAKIHLTNRGFVPINKSKKKKNNINNIISIPKPIELSNEFFLSDKYKSFLEESEINVEDISSVDSSLSESIFD